MFPCARFLTKDARGWIRCTAGGGTRPEFPGAATVASSDPATIPFANAAVFSAAGVKSFAIAVMDAIIRLAGICVAGNGRTGDE